MRVTGKKEAGKFYYQSPIGHGTGKSPEREEKISLGYDENQKTREHMKLDGTFNELLHRREEIIDGLLKRIRVNTYKVSKILEEEEEQNP